MLNIMFICDLCHRSLAVVPPVKYVFDFIQIMGII